MIHWKLKTDTPQIRFTVPRIAAPWMNPALTHAQEGQRLLRRLPRASKLRLVATHGVREQGQTMADYAVVLAVVVLAGVACITVLSGSIIGRLTSFAATIGSLVP
jgi:Flp pilus assembly pilin Flp